MTRQRPLNVWLRLGWYIGHCIIFGWLLLKTMPRGRSKIVNPGLALLNTR